MSGVDELRAEVERLREGIRALADEFDLEADPLPWAAERVRTLIGLSLCDGCDEVTTGVVASDDGRAQMCPTCLPVANAPRREVWGISYGPSAPVRVHPSEDSARAAAADVTRGGEVVVFRGGKAWEPAPKGYWYVTKPQHGYTCGCDEEDQHVDQREWVPAPVSSGEAVDPAIPVSVAMTDAERRTAMLAARDRTRRGGA